MAFFIGSARVIGDCVEIVAMSRTTPRQGRYVKLLPAMLLYFAYMTALDILRRKMSEGDINIAPGMLTVHVLFLAVAILLLFGDDCCSGRHS